MKTKTVTAETKTDKRELAKAGEEGSKALLVQRAREIVEKIHAGSTRATTMEERAELRIEISGILGDADAKCLHEEMTELVALRCKGGSKADPFDIGRISNLHEALEDCKEYLKTGPMLSTTMVSENGETDIWGGMGSV